jgi:phosphatidylserine/phosphatidylglycerophosphate/cardiolipin synthase-like enzyme
MLETISKTKLVVGKAYHKSALSLIDGASRSIEILMYEWKWYENDPGSYVQRLNQAIIRAVRRGVKVRALVNEAGQAERLRVLGIEARTNFSSVVMHTKALVVDGEHVLIGSHNFTEKAMTSNIETSIYYCDKEQARQLADLMISLWL